MTDATISGPAAFAGAPPSGAGVVVRPADVGLRREIGLIGATWASETSIIGSGWLFGALYAAQAAGTAALVGWVIGGVAIIILALVHAELGAMYPVAGGTARFPHLAYGSIAGTSFGFFSWLQAVTVAPIECFAVFQYAAYFDPGLYNPSKGVVTGAGFALTIVTLAVFTVLNFLAMRYFNLVSSGITWWKVAIPLITIVILLFKMHTSSFDVGGFNPFGWKAVFGAIPSAGIVFAYLGFEQADQLAGEIKNPQKNLPRAIILAIAIGTLIYIGLQVVFIGAMPHSVLAKGWAGITNNNILEGPFAGLAAVAGLGIWATILRVDAFVSPFGTGNIYVTSTSRIGYGLGRNRYYPQIFTWIDRNGVPWVSLIFAFLLGIVFLLPFPSWHSLVNLVTDASVLMYAGAPLALGAFRLQVPEAERPYRMPLAWVLGPVAFIVASMLIYWSGFLYVWKLGVCIVIGYVLIGISMAFDKKRPPLQWRSAIWLPVYLIGMGVISWQGQYSGQSSCGVPGTNACLPPVNTNNIPFWYDMLVVAGFSLGIYIWAILTRLPRDEMLALVEAQSGVEEAPATVGVGH